MITIPARKFKLFIIGIILFILVAERLFFLSGAATAPANPYGTWRIRKTTFPRKSFLYNNQQYEVKSFGMFTTDKKPLEIIFDPGNPEKAYVNSFGEVWAVRIVFHLLAIIIFEVCSSLFIGRNDAIEIGRNRLRIISMQPKTTVKPVSPRRKQPGGRRER